MPSRSVLSNGVRVKTRRLASPLPSLKIPRAHLPDGLNTFLMIGGALQPVLFTAYDIGNGLNGISKAGAQLFTHRKQCQGRVLGYLPGKFQRDRKSVV